MIKRKDLLTKKKKVLKIFIASHKVFCRFFANVGHIIATRKVVPLLKWCSYGSTVLSRVAAWLTDIPVKVHRFGAIWRIHVYTLIYYVSKANPNLWKTLKTEHCNYKITRIHLVLPIVELLTNWRKYTPINCRLFY